MCVCVCVCVCVLVMHQYKYNILLFGLTASPFRIVNLLMWKRLTICVEKVRGMAIGC